MSKLWLQTIKKVFLTAFADDEYIVCFYAFSIMLMEVCDAAYSSSDGGVWEASVFGRTLENVKLF